MEETIKGRLEPFRLTTKPARASIALEQRSVELRRQLLRLLGAIQVLEEATEAADLVTLAEALA